VRENHDVGKNVKHRSKHSLQAKTATTINII